jgi:hypothetical protein
MRGSSEKRICIEIVVINPRYISPIQPELGSDQRTFLAKIFEEKSAGKQVLLGQISQVPRKSRGRNVLQ